MHIAIANSIERICLTFVTPHPDKSVSRLATNGHDYDKSKTNPLVKTRDGFVYIMLLVLVKSIQHPTNRSAALCHVTDNVLSFS